MTVYLVVLLSLLNSIAHRGAKVAVSLYALELGAGAAAVGVLAALFAAFPLLLAVRVARRLHRPLGGRLRHRARRLPARLCLSCRIGPRARLRRHGFPASG